MNAYLYSYTPVHVRWGNYDPETATFSASSDLMVARQILEFQKTLGKNWFVTNEKLSVGTWVKRGKERVFRYKRPAPAPSFLIKMITGKQENDPHVPGVCAR